MSNFYIVDLEHFATASRRYTGDIHNSPVVGLFMTPIGQYRKQLTKVKVAGTLSEWFRVKKGVRQGCVLSPYLFNILAEMVMRETIDGFQGGLQIGGRMITNLRCADDIILLATSEAELQELVDRLDRVSRKYSLLINVDKTNVMVSDGIACRILFQNELLE